MVWTASAAASIPPSSAVMTKMNFQRSFFSMAFPPVPVQRGRHRAPPLSPLYYIQYTTLSPANQFFTGPGGGSWDRGKFLSKIILKKLFTSGENYDIILTVMIPISKFLGEEPL